jgi:glycosyltransferase involved in cell wall biosynthesis
LISDAGPHPYFRTLIEGGDGDRGRLAVGCVGPSGALQADMADLGVKSFALGACNRAAYPLAAMRLARLLRARRAQVVQTHLVDGSLVGLAAARLARTPVAVLTAHHSHELPFQGPRLRWVDRVCGGPMSDYIIAPSRDVAGTLVREAHVREAKIEVVHHGFDLERLDPERVDGRRVRAELGLGDAMVFGAIGRLYWLKNYEALIRAFAAVDGDARLVLAGAGDPSSLETLADSLGIGERVLLCGPRTDIPELLAAFDVFVHPAIAESFGMVIIEAMAMARPVLSTPVGIAPEVIDSHVTGLLASSAEPRALEEALRTMIELRPRWPQIGAAGRERVAGFSANAMAARYAELYETWLDASSRTGP